jgi:hypothetical protein
LTGAGEGANDNRLRRRKGADNCLRIYEGECTMRKISLFGPSRMRRHSGYRKIALVASLAAITVLAATAGIGGAATPLPSLTVTVVPKPAVTAGQNVLSILKFEYPAGASPTTITGVFVLVEIPAGSDFKAAPLSSPNCKSQSVGIVRCDIGNVRTGDNPTTIFVVVNAPSSAPTTGTPISISGTAYWNENVNGSNPRPNNSVPADPDSTFVFPSTGVVNTNGKCTVGGSSLDTSTQFGGSNQQATHVDYPANDQGFPCTPASIQDDLTAEPNNGSCAGGVRACKFSQIVLPKLPEGSFATDVIKFDGSLFPSPGSGPSPTTFRVLELLDPPDPTTEIVPLCSTGNRTAGGACEITAAKFGSRGIQVTLSIVPQGLIDPRYGG